MPLVSEGKPGIVTADAPTWAEIVLRVPPGQPHLPLAAKSHNHRLRTNITNTPAADWPRVPKLISTFIFLAIVSTVSYTHLTLPTILRV